MPCELGVIREKINPVRRRVRFMDGKHTELSELFDQTLYVVDRLVRQGAHDDALIVLRRLIPECKPAESCLV
jgi:hypothetical protein